MEERTEPATAKRRRKAREEGQVARSTELVGSGVLLGALWALPELWPTVSGHIVEYCSGMLLGASQREVGNSGLQLLANRCLIQIGLLALPILGFVSGGALITNLVQVGWAFSPKAFMPNFSRLEPLAGLKRMVSGRSGVELAKGVVKVGLVGWIGWRFLSGHREELLRLSTSNPAQIAPQIGEMTHQMSVQMVSMLTVLAAADYAYQRWQFERSIRMTKQEVPDEMREAEGNPQVRSRIRQRQREMSRRRMMAAVPSATLVITNPTHFAVALQYESGQAGAPRLLAKGRNLIAQRIRELATANRVPIVQNPPLARSIHDTVEIGAEIPASLYRAVAEVIALVWRAERRLTGS